MTDDPSAPSGGLSASESRWLAVFAAIMGLRTLGFALMPALLVEAPILLMLMYPFTGTWVLAGAIVDPWIYFGLGMTAAIVQSVVAFHFGWALGPRALAWLEGQGRLARTATRWTHRLMRWAAPLVIVSLAGPVVSALSGVTKFRGRYFYPLITTAFAGWITACYYFGAQVTEQIEAIEAFFEAHLLELSIVGVVWLIASYLYKRYRGGQSAPTSAS